MKSVYLNTDYIYDCERHTQCVEITNGLKVRVNAEQLANLQSDPYIQDFYTLKVKRLNRWYWSVYFERKLVDTLAST